MRTRSQSRRRRQQQTPPVVVENFDLEEPIVDQNIVAIADNRTMAQMLQAPIEGYEDAIVVPPINANNFELKQPLINLVQSNKFTGRQDPHNHLRFFNKVTSTFRHPEVPNTSIKLERDIGVLGRWEWVGVSCDGTWDSGKARKTMGEGFPAPVLTADSSSIDSDFWHFWDFGLDFAKGLFHSMRSFVILACFVWDEQDLQTWRLFLTYTSSVILPYRCTLDIQSDRQWKPMKDAKCQKESDCFNLQTGANTSS
ncbi:hypothetical protein Tco_0995042 [Tanacetum coccineum]